VDECRLELLARVSIKSENSLFTESELGAALEELDRRVRVLDRLSICAIWRERDPLLSTSLNLRERELNFSFFIHRR